MENAAENMVRTDNDKEQGEGSEGHLAHGYGVIVERVLNGRVIAVKALISIPWNIKYSCAKYLYAALRKPRE